MTWEEWKRALEAEAAEIEDAADTLSRATVTVRVGHLGKTGERLLDNAQTGLLTERDRWADRIRGRAKPLLDMIVYAKWLGDPARAAMLEVVSQPSYQAQRDAMWRVRLSKVAANTIGYRYLWRPDGDTEADARIDRIIEGARLYAATKVSP